MSPMLPATWAVAPIDHLGTIKGGGTPKTSEPRYWQGGDIPWVSPKDMKSFEVADAQDHITPCAVEESSTKLIKAGAVLLVIRSGILQHSLPVAISTVPVTLNQDMKAIEPHVGIDPRFLAYGLMANAGRILHECSKTGTTVQSVEIPQLRQFHLPIAPSAEQVRVADRIDELFTDLSAGVAALERVKRNLARYRAAVLHAAVTGKLTEAWRKEHGPADEPGPKLLQRILAERRRLWEQRTLAKYEKAGKKPPKNWKSRYPEPVEPRPLVDGAELSALPPSWCWASADQLGWIQLGRQRSPKNRSNKFPTKYIRAANITENGLDLSDVLDMEFEPHELEVYKLMVGDIVLSEASGSATQVGKPAIWRGELPDCAFQNTVIRLRPTIVSNEYLFTFFLYCYRCRIFATVAGGVGINHLSADKFSRIPVALPPMDEQAAIVEAVNEKLSQIDALEAEVERGLRRAGRLRQAILKAAFEGKLVPQDPRDEPASVLLERIRKEAAENGHSTKRRQSHKASRKTMKV